MTQLTGKTESVLLGGADARPATLRIGTADLARLTKVRITVMVVVTTAIGFMMASRGASEPQWLLMTVTLVGTALCCMGASVLNQVLERDTDALMNRTRKRPLPAGRVATVTALGLGLLLSAAGVSILMLGATLMAAGLAAFTVLSYALVYTPMKRVSGMATIVGAVPGALPPVIGAAAATGGVGIEALLLFAIMFLWQLPHFLAIAWLYREDYARAGIPVLPAVEPDGVSTFRQILFGCLALLPLGLMPTLLGVTGPACFVGALIAGAGFLASAIWLWMKPGRSRAKLAFYVSLLYLPAVFALMLIDQVPAAG